MHSGFYIFSMLASACSIYAFVCFVRVMLSWFPGAQYSKAGQFLISVCDPYLNLFRRFKFLRIGMIDLSAAVGICVLYAASAVFRNFVYTGHVSLTGFLIVIISMLWRLVFDIFVFLWVLLVIRLVFMLLHKDNTPVFYQIDSSLSRFVFKISGIFRGGRPTSLKTALIISIIFLAAVFVAANYLVGLLIAFLESAGGLSFRGRVNPASGPVTSTPAASFEGV